MTGGGCALGDDCPTRQESAGGVGIDRYVLCHGCVARVERIIAELPADVYDLSQAIARQNTPLDGPGAPGKPASKPPINLLIDALRSQIVYTASVWEEVVRDYERLSSRRNGRMRDGASIEQSAKILSPRVSVLAGLPHTDGYFDGVESGLVARRGMDGVRRLIALHDTARRALGLTEMVIRLPGECGNHRCRAHAMRRVHGSDAVWCDACEGRWTYDDYTRWVRLVIGEAS